jgi:hypothetical protein
VLIRRGGVWSRRIWAKQMSTFGYYLIERLRTRLVDFQPQTNWKKGRSPREEFENQRRMRKRALNEQILITSSSPVGVSVADDGDSFDGF